jgi:hypothetical protein
VSGTAFFVGAVVLTVAGAALLGRAWPTRTSRLVVFAVAAFGSVVVAFQLLAVLAAALKAPLVRPPWLLGGSGLVATLCWLAGRFVARRCPEGAPAAPARGGPDGSSARWGRWIPLFIVGGVASALLPHAVLLGLSAPPRGWDVLAYHMPRALSWLQRGNLGAYGSEAAFYPGNAEIAILFSLFTGTDRIASLVQLPFALLGALGVYGIARELGARMKPATASAIVFLAAPIVLFQSALAKDDLVVTGLVVAGAYLLLRSTRRRPAGGFGGADLAASGFSFGLALGVKYSILAFSIGLIPLVLVLNVLAARAGVPAAQGSAWRSAVPRTCVFTAMLMAPAAFWFVQNLVVAGVPFAPLSFGVVSRAFGRHDPSYVTHVAAWLWFPWIDRAVQGSYSASVGYGAAFAALGLPGLAAWVWLAARGRLSAGARLRSIALLGLVSLGAVTWWLGGHHLPRFLLPVVALVCAPVALLLDRAVREVKLLLIVVQALAGALSVGEALRVIYRGDDLVSSRMDFVGAAECYHMPRLIYELPPGTRIMVLDMPGVDVQRTFRYPVAGRLPGNDVVMHGDIGVESDLITQGPVAGHANLVRDEIDYLFLRTLALPPGATVFDKYPDMYEKVLDLVEPPYAWYRKGYLSTPGGGFDERAPAVTKMYRVVRAARAAPADAPNPP